MISLIYKDKKPLDENILGQKLFRFQIEELRPKSHCLSESEFAILGVQDLEIFNFCNEIFDQEVFAFI